LRAFGTPQDVAARYFEPWILIPQTETRKFTVAAIIGASVLIALSPLTSVGSGQLAIAILAWIGALVINFGIWSFAQRRKTVANLWVPRDGDHVSRVGSLLQIAMICLGVVAYGAPRWLFSQLSHGKSLAAWLDYDPAFHSSRLPVLFFLWGCQAILLAVLVGRGRWNTVLRRADVCLEIGIVLALIWFMVAGHVFKEVVPNTVALSALRVFALLVFVDVGVKLYRGVSRIPGRSAELSTTA
jgi:hypothetical protein